MNKDQKYIIDKAISQILFDFQNEYSFYGNLLQILQIKSTNLIPTAGVQFDYKNKSFILLINMNWMSTLNENERVGVLLHEVLHISHKHLISVPKSILENKNEIYKYNISMDIAINQLIKILPKEALKIEQFKHKDKTQKLLEFQPFEYYYENIDWDQANKEMMTTLDEHDFLNQKGVSEEDLLKASSELLKRTIQKTSFSHSKIPKEVEETLEKIKEKLSKIDYKRLLYNVIKKSIPISNRTNTWMRPSRRYGYIAPGTKASLRPNVHVFLDKSGSISMEEIQEFTNELYTILKQAECDVMLHLFHTNVYHSSKFKRKMNFFDLPQKSGGTCLQDCFDKLKNNKVDVAIFLTDGYYEDVKLNYKPHFETVFVISKNGQKNHPIKYLGQTVQII